MLITVISEAIYKYIRYLQPHMYIQPYIGLYSPVWYRVFLNIPYSDFSVFLGVSVCTNTSAAAELAECRKITTFEEKNTIFNEHPVS